MLRNILLVVAGILVVLLVVIFTRSPTYRVSRSTNVAAPPAVVYGEVVDFRQWVAWSPWGALDPTMRLTYSGPTSGPGAAYAWVGNDKVGEGKMLITGSKPNEEVNIKLDFLKPFEATALTGFTFEPASGGGTKVTWSMTGENNFVMKAMSIVHDMDADIGKDFDRGLAALKSVSEAEAKRQAAEAARKAAADAAAAQAAAELAAQQAAAEAAAAKPAKRHK
jgi:Polyketide cyclase / dehydrase and lipid transport